MDIEDKDYELWPEKFDSRSAAERIFSWTRALSSLRVKFDSQDVSIFRAVVKLWIWRWENLGFVEEWL